MGNGNGNNDVSRFTKWIKLISYIVAVVVGIGGVIWGANKHMELTYAHAKDLTQVVETITMNSQEIQSMRLEQQLSRLYGRVWQLEKQYGFGCQSCPPEYRQEYNNLKLEIEHIKRRLRKLDS